MAMATSHLVVFVKGWCASLTVKVRDIYVWNVRGALVVVLPVL